MGEEHAFVDVPAAAEFVQQAVSFLSTKGKGKGKGKGRKGGFPVRPSSMSIAGRKKKLEELKKRTE